MKIAIVRGAYLNRFEMQTFEPLAAVHGVTAYAAYRHKYDTGIIELPVRKLRGWSGILVHGYLFGLEGELAHYDIAHVAELSNGYSYQAVRARRRNPHLRVVVTTWENIPLRRLQFSRVRFSHSGWRRHVVEEADAFVAVTERAKAALLVEGVPNERIHVLPMGVDVSRFAPRVPDPLVRRVLNVAPEDFLVLFVGRLTWGKGAHDVIFAAKMLGDAVGRHVRFVLLGDGPERRRLQRYVEQLGLSDVVQFRSAWPYNEMHRLFNASDAFVLPSLPEPRWQEQFGFVLVEAMASGLPVVTTASGSILEVVGDAAIIVPPGDPFGLAGALRVLADDPKECSRLGQLGRRRAVERFDAQTVAHEYERLYLSLEASQRHAESVPR